MTSGEALEVGADAPLAPFRCAPRFVARAWGSGERLRARFGLDAPPGTGEAWLVSDVAGAPSPVLDGPFAGRTLRDVFTDARAALVGDTDDEDFPLLVKLIDINAPLSVQVHPDGPTARALGDGRRGKAEAWLVIDAGQGAKVSLGLREPLSPDEVVRLAREGGLEQALRTEAARAGQAYEILPGTLHTALDLVALEVQETADVTYRVYDWGRDRPLHLEQARVTLARTGGAARRPRIVEVPPAPDAARRTALVSGEAPFTFDVVDLPPGAAADLGSDGGPGPAIAFALDGDVVLETPAGPVTLRRGEAAVVPASAGGLTARPVGPPARLAHAAARPGVRLGHGSVS
ncbi:MAG: class I mannose-6-phosphate isomerase [Planctomycetes bacterium]|nr:class I mannose-6-phosphate isomerase [Planctomycetota bacterium]